MRVRLLFRTYEISDVNKQQLLYGVAVLISILSVFGFIFLLSFYSDSPSSSPFPSPTTSAFTNNLEAAANAQPQVAGAQTQIQQPVPESEKGPQIPPPKPSPSPSPLPSPSPSPAVSPSPASSPSPSATANPEPSPTPDNRPRITNIAESDKTADSIKIKFSVDKSSDCKAFYWSDPASKKEQESSTKRTTSPEISLTGLTSGTEYTYNLECRENEHGNTSSAGDYKFKTN